MYFKDITHRIVECGKRTNLPYRAGLETLKRSNRAIGTRDPPNNCRAPRHPGEGVLQPLSDRVYRLPLRTTRIGGAITTQGAGVHPGDGVLQPQGARSYPRPICANMEEGRAGHRGTVSIPSDG